jgi:Zn-dependent protease
MGWVAAAGPVSNLLMAIGWAILMRFALSAGTENWFALPLLFMGVAGIYINTILMVLNLLPLPPLDGGRVMTGLLPHRAAMVFSRIEPYGLWILIALLMSGVLGKIMWPFVAYVLSAMVSMTGISYQDYQRILMSLMGG